MVKTGLRDKKIRSVIMRWGMHLGKWNAFAVA
jgi:hypothetical protein